MLTPCRASTYEQFELGQCQLLLLKTIQKTSRWMRFYHIPSPMQGVVHRMFTGHVWLARNAGLNKVRSSGIVYSRSDNTCGVTGDAGRVDQMPSVEALSEDCLAVPGAALSALSGLRV